MRPAGLLRGVVAEQVVISTQLDPFFTLRALAQYSGLSPRKLQDHLRDPHHPLPAYKVGGKLLVRRSEFDAWIANFRHKPPADIDRIVDEALQGLR